ncbi:hypothetical protein [Treponema saccharophilum]|uniref:hypothetical protein n=1 Tax=Treponema saccharophilum TaxID=165 RepID=UPI003869176B
MKKRNLLLAVLLQAALLMNFASCSDDDEEEYFDSKISNLKFLSIENAKNLYISTDNTAGRAASDTKKIFKITEDGYTEEVKYLDEDNKEVSLGYTQPCAIQPVNDEYIFVGFGYGGNSISSSYLVRKTDGTVFSLENAGNPDKISSSYKNEKLLKTDKNNNLYFLSYGSGIKKVVKVNLSGIDSLSATTVSASTDYVYNFDVDWNGNVIYKGYLTSDSSNAVRRLRKANGGLANLSENNALWIGLDGTIYYFNGSKYDSTTYTASYPIYKITVNSDGAINDTLYGNFEASAYFYQDWSYKLELQNEILIIYASGNDSKIYEVYNETGTPRVVSLDSLSMKSVTAVASTENFYYIAGTDKSNNTFLIKVDPTDDSYTNLLPQNDYDVYSFTASETDGIIFNALRMNDGKKIIGKVGIDGGDVTMIDEESDVQITYLERIN